MKTERGFKPIYFLYIGSGLILTAFAVKKIYNIVKSDSQGQDRQTVNEAEKEIKQSDLTYSQAEYQQMSDELYRSMNETGTDVNTIVRIILKVKNKSDWYALVKAFGMRKSTSWFSSFNGNLASWLSDDLSDTPAVMTQISNYLNKYGIAI